MSKNLIFKKPRKRKLDYQVIYNEVIQDNKEITPAEFEKQLEKDYKA